MKRIAQPATTALVTTLLTACAAVGPDFEQPVAEIEPEWTQPVQEGLSNAPIEQETWWTLFQDPVLDALVETARENNNNLEIAGIRVLEAVPDPDPRLEAAARLCAGFGAIFAGDIERATSGIDRAIELAEERDCPVLAGELHEARARIASAIASRSRSAPRNGALSGKRIHRAPASAA